MRTGLFCDISDHEEVMNLVYYHEERHIQVYSYTDPLTYTATHPRRQQSGFIWLRIGSCDDVL
jgi:hypothetical protein